MMQENLKIALIQADLIWEDPEQNLENFSKKIENISETVDLIILPEMFTTGFYHECKKCCRIYGRKNGCMDAIYSV